MSNVKRRIGLTMRTVQAAGYDEPRDALAQLWPAFLAQALPEANWMYLPSLKREEIIEYCSNWGINGLILTGGEDVGTSVIRDQSETALLEWAAKKTIPVLGVCRGLQLMSKVAGSNLTQVAGHIASRHGLVGQYDWQVNSYHSAGLADVPAGYEILAQAEDGTIEAIRHKELLWEGWMWHPEREAPFSAYDIREIRRIFR